MFRPMSSCTGRAVIAMFVIGTLFLLLPHILIALAAVGAHP